MRQLSTALLLASVLSLGAGAGHACAQLNALPKPVQEAGIEEKLGRDIPGDLTFVDENGKTVHLADYFKGDKPVVLNFAYHTCPVLCNLVLNATIDVLTKQQWTVGKEFTFVSISINPEDSPASAKEKRLQAIQKYGRGNGEGMHFLTGTEENIAKAADAAGFKYSYDKQSGQYAHAAAMMLLTPTGRMARYLYGVSFNPKDVKLGLLEASQGRSMSTAEKIILYCYKYDPKGHRYAVVAGNVMKLGGVLTMIGLFAFLFVMWRRELRRKPNDPHAPSSLRPDPMVSR